MFFLYIFSVYGLSLFAQRLPDLIPYRKKDKWGYADSTGKILIKPKYVSAGWFQEGKARVETENSYLHIDEQGVVLPGTAVLKAVETNYALPFPDYSSPLPAEHNGKWGYIYSKGDTAVPFLFEKAFKFHDWKWAVVVMNGKAGYIDRNGKWKLPPVYDTTMKWYGARMTFMNGRAIVKENGCCKLIDTAGRSLTSGCYDDVTNYSALNVFRYNMVMRNGKCGAIDSTFREIIPLIYDTVHLPWKQETAIKVVKEDTSMIIDIKTNQRLFLLPATSRDAQYGTNHIFHEGIMMLCVNDKWGFINRKGEWIASCIYDSLWDFWGGHAAVMKGEKYGLIDTTGKFVLPMIYDYIFNHPAYITVGLKTDRKKVDGKPVYHYGVVSPQGKPEVPIEFESVMKIDSNLYQVRVNGVWQNMDTYGRRYWED